MITIMTPTYNRAYILPETYASLKTQTSFDFEWIIIDDGSTDETEQIVMKWMQEEKNFPILYQKQANGGKHRAVNRGVSLAKYDYFFIVDSDDRLTENAVELIHNWIADIDGLDGFAGVSGLKGNDNVIGGYIKNPYIDATNLERKKYGLLGDKAEVYKTEILKKYPFPEFEGEKFIRESSAWDRIAKDGFKIRWYNELIYLCEYIEDGLTKNTGLATYAKNYLGYTFCAKLYLETRSFLQRINKCGEIRMVSKIKGMSVKKTAEEFSVSTFTIVVGSMYYRFRQFVKRIVIKLKSKRK